jgi:hypothetical protein
VAAGRRPGNCELPLCRTGRGRLDGLGGRGHAVTHGGIGGRLIGVGDRQPAATRSPGCYDQTEHAHKDSELSFPQ